MKVAKGAKKKLDEAYSPVLTPAALALKAETPLHVVYTYLGERLFREQVAALDRKGLSRRQIGEALQASHVTVHRILSGQQ